MKQAIISSTATAMQTTSPATTPATAPATAEELLLGSPVAEVLSVGLVFGVAIAVV